MKFGIFQICLIAVNIVHMSLGTGIAIEGIFFKFGSYIFQDDIEYVLGFIEVDTSNADDLINSLADLFIVTGFFICGIGLFGFIAACFKSKLMLVIFAVLVILLLVILAVGVGLFASFKGEIDKGFYEDARILFKKQYSRFPTVTKGFNKLFETLHCCGMSDASDVAECAYPLPQECCSGDICTLENAYQVKQRRKCYCTTEMEMQSFSPSQGCITRFDDLFTQYNKAFIGVGSVTMLFQVLCVGLAIGLYRNKGDGE